MRYQIEKARLGETGKASPNRLRIHVWTVANTRNKKRSEVTKETQNETLKGKWDMGKGDGNGKKRTGSRSNWARTPWSNDGLP